MVNGEKSYLYIHEAGRFMTYRQFKRWSMTRVSVRETKDLLRRRRLGWRP